MTRMRLTQDRYSVVTISYDDCTFEPVRVERRFNCPIDGGYVRERNPYGDWNQICDCLYRSGETLSAPSRDALPDVIRREYRAMRADYKREQAAADFR